ncbi:MAG: DUF4914 family protein, partial [Planctomycetota bacterium]|nr:DUF4914 family protein [Planctomycetota bacterium]
MGSLQEKQIASAGSAVDLMVQMMMPGGAARRPEEEGADSWSKEEIISILRPPAELREIFEACKCLRAASTIEEQVVMSYGGDGSRLFETAYELPDGKRVVEAVTAKVRNGVVANYTEPYMRRRDPDCMLIGDDLPTDKET